MQFVVMVHVVTDLLPAPLGWVGPSRFARFSEVGLRFSGRMLNDFTKQLVVSRRDKVFDVPILQVVRVPQVPSW